MVTQPAQSTCLGTVYSRSGGGSTKTDGIRRFLFTFCPCLCRYIQVCPCRGGELIWTSQLEGVVRQRIPGAHQHPGDPGCRTDSGIFSPPASWAECCPDEQQHVSRSLPLVSGGTVSLPFVPDGLCHRHLGRTALNSSGCMVHSRQKYSDL